MKHEQSLRTVLFDLPFFFFIPLVVSCEDERRRVEYLCLMKEGEASMVLQTFVPYCILLRVCVSVCIRVCLHGVNAGESCEHENKTSQKGALGNQVYNSKKMMA